MVVTDCEVLAKRFLLIKLDVAKLGIKLTPGDHLAVFPKNREKDVKQIIPRLNIDADPDFHLCLINNGNKLYFRQFATAVLILVVPSRPA